MAWRQPGPLKDLPATPHRFSAKQLHSPRMASSGGRSTTQDPSTGPTPDLPADQLRRASARPKCARGVPALTGVKPEINPASFPSPTPSIACWGSSGTLGAPTSTIGTVVRRPLANGGPTGAKGPPSPHRLGGSRGPFALDGPRSSQRYSSSTTPSTSTTERPDMAYEPRAAGHEAPTKPVGPPRGGPDPASAARTSGASRAVRSALTSPLDPPGPTSGATNQGGQGAAAGRATRTP